MKIYTCGYMFESGRFNWRHAFECKIKHPWITWLHPDPDEQDAEVYLYNDKQMIIDSDVVLIYVDLVVARYLGAMLELGMAYCLGKKIIMIDLSPDVDSLTMARKCCDFVLPTIGAGIQLLEKMANEQS